MNRKRLIPLLLAVMLLLAAVPVGFALASGSAEAAPQAKIATPVLNEGEQTMTAPKYVFLFIGDGMTYPQFQATAAFLSINKDKDTILTTSEMLNFMKFPVAGSATTYDSTSFCPDSASTATSLASGHKTYSGVLNMNEAKNKAYTTIAESLKAAGYKIGIISSVNLNHATPAAFYAHQPSRNNYYEIGLEMIDSGFDYFGGGALLKPTGDSSDKPQTDLYELAATAGYKVVKTQAEAQALAADAGKAIVIAEDLADSASMSYEIDRADTAWALKDYVQQGTTMLENDKGFFMMVEGGKIDWSCHANDAGSTIHDTIALADAVQVAIDFAAKHPAETLILVTGDHETGGLTIGYAGTNYNTYLKNINAQTISYAKYDADYVAKYVEAKTPFETAMTDVTALFGLTMPAQAESATNKSLVLTDYEVAELKKAYDITLAGGFGTDANGKSLQTQQEYVQYGTYTPFSVTVTHLLNNKSGINFSSYSHTGLPAAVFASGAGQELFVGGYDNTDVYYKLAQLLGIG